MHSKDIVSKYFIETMPFNPPAVSAMNACLRHSEFFEGALDSSVMHELSQQLVGLMMNGVPDGDFTDRTPMRVQIHLSAVFNAFKVACVNSPDFMNAINGDPSDWMHTEEFKDIAIHTSQMMGEDFCDPSIVYEVPLVNWVRDFAVELEAMSQDFVPSPDPSP